MRAILASYLHLPSRSVKKNMEAAEKTVSRVSRFFVPRVSSSSTLVPSESCFHMCLTFLLLGSPFSFASPYKPLRNISGDILTSIP